MYRTPDSTRTVAFPDVLTLRLPAAVEVELVLGADQADDEAGSSAGGGNRREGGGHHGQDAGPVHHVCFAHAVGPHDFFLIDDP